MPLCEVIVVLELNKYLHSVWSASMLSLLGEHAIILAGERAVAKAT